eukprot:4157173-Pyramimonas_sp.AAC.1
MGLERGAEAVTTSGDDVDPPGAPGVPVLGPPQQGGPRASFGRPTDRADPDVDGASPTMGPPLGRRAEDRAAGANSSPNRSNGFRLDSAAPLPGDTGADARASPSL